MLTDKLVLALLDFEKIFEVECYASHMGTGGVLRQEGHQIVFLSEKIDEVMEKYSTYEVELYAILQALRHWHSFLIQRDFILNSDHEALNNINNHANLNRKHVGCIGFLFVELFLLAQT